jgi:hypothetical protein
MPKGGAEHSSIGYMQDRAQMVVRRLDGCLVGRMEQCILNGSVQDEAEP